MRNGGGVGERLIERKDGDVDLVAEGLARVVGHRNKDVAVSGAVHFVDGADVGMVERGGGASFGDQAGGLGGIAAAVFAEELDSDRALEVEVASAIDDAHAALAEDLLELVVRNDLSYHVEGDCI